MNAIRSVSLTRVSLMGMLLLSFASCESTSLQDRLLPYHPSIHGPVVLNDETSAVPTTIAQQIEAAGIPDSSRTYGYVLEEGEEAIFTRAWLSEHSERSIDIQYFIFSMDNVGLIALDYLLHAADRGVKVRMLVDDIMLDVGIDDVLALNAHPNVSIRVYNPTEGKNLASKAVNVVSDFQGFNQRMHNKTFVVDGRVAITGGRNIADEYFDYDQAYNFRDRDVLLIGPGAASIQTSFDGFWNDPLAVDLNGDAPTAEATDALYASIHHYAADPANFWPQIRALIDGIPEAIPHIVAAGKLHLLEDFRFESDAPGKNETGGFSGGGQSTDALMALVESATTSLTVQSPYLVLTDLGLELFGRAVERGVSVSILTNSLCSTDNLEAFNGYQRIRADLLERGVQVYEYRPDAEIRKQLITAAKQERLGYVPVFGLHAKSMVVDHRTVVVGTFNLDPRSANLNTECVAIMESDAMAAQVEALMLRELAPENAWHTTADWNPDGQAGGWKQMRCWLRGIVPAAVL